MVSFSRSVNVSFKVNVVVVLVKNTFKVFVSQTHLALCGQSLYNRGLM